LIPKESFRNWSVPTDQLTGRRKTGGRISIGGFAFQEAFACLYLARLLDSGQVIAVRYEGAQDLDVFYADGREKYVQIKKEPHASYTLKKLAPVLQGFAIDFAEADRKESLSFELVARSNHIDAAVSRLCKQKPTLADLDEVARSLSQLATAPGAPVLFSSIKYSDWSMLAEQLLMQTILSFGLGDEMEGQLSFQSHACTELARHGIAGAHLQNAFEALRSALRPQRTFTRADVRETLKRFTGGAAIDIFRGRVEALTDELLSTASSPEEVRQFYEGEKRLDWRIIAAGGDIARSQQEDLVSRLESPSETLKIFCLVAEPGAGKSTLARRLAAELHHRHGALVIRLKDKEDADPWYLMSQFHEKVASPFYVLVDDLFRTPAVVAALHELNSSLPITILATSRENEFRPGGLKNIMQAIPVAQPSPEEKARILERLGKSRDELTPSQRTRLDSAKQFLALMMEVTEGKALREIVRDTVTRLQAADKLTYRAYEYVCFSYMHSVLIPVSLLERLDSAGRFHNLPHREQSKGIIFYDEGREGFLSAGHPVLAETAWAFYDRASATVLREIGNAVDSSNRQETYFFTVLLSVMARTNPAEINEALPQIQTAIEKCQQSAGISELSSWTNFYRKLGKRERAEACVDRALTLIPTDATDCNLLFGMFRSRGRERDALPAIAEWVRRSPDSYGGKTAYLGLIERYGSADEQKAVIEKTHAWLLQHRDDTSVRTYYLAIVERVGTPEHVSQVLQEISTWLTRHDDDTSVRTRYVGLVERNGTPEQVEQVLQETSTWLARHDDDTSVRTRYVGLVERSGTPEQVQQVLQETSTWLARHDDDTSVRRVYFGLVERKGTPDQVARLLPETGEWLARHDDDTHVRLTYLVRMEKNGTPAQIKQVLQETRAWLARHDNVMSVRSYYAGMVERKGTPAQVKQVLAEMDEWLARHDNDTSVRSFYLGLVDRKGTPEKIQEVLQATKDWLQRHSMAQEVWEALIASLISKGNTDDSADLVQQALSYYPNQRNLTSHYIRVLQSEVDKKKVEHAYARLMRDFPQDEDIPRYFADWLREHNSWDEARVIYQQLMEHRPDDYRLLYAYGRLLLKEQKLSEAMTHFQKALKLRPDHQLAHEGLAFTLRLIGELAEQQGKQDYADRFFINSEQEYRDAINYAGEKEQPQTRFYANLGWLYISRARYADALSVFEAALTGNPDYWECHWGAGTALFNLGRFQSAADALRAASKNSQNNVQPPASEEIPRLYQQCLQALGQNDLDSDENRSLGK
jgi:tetratricopeptide (TPR) repeat protein/energy-coupling factor transporter ATP-binding protein EcfA2